MTAKRERIRIERTGAVTPLTPRVDRFLREALKGKSLDDLQHPSLLRADYSCLNGVLAIELKTLEEDASERMENLTEELRQRPDWPLFLGSAPMDSFLKNLPDEEQVRLQVIDRLGRAIVNHLKKANKQLAAHTVSFPRKNTLRVMFLINEDHEIYDPDVVAYVLHHALRRSKDGVPLYQHLDAVIFMTERRATKFGERLAFPVLSVEGFDVERAAWKATILDYVLRCWGEWNQNPMFSMAPGDLRFSTIDHIPDSAPRHERWRTDYRRNPYLRAVSKEELRDRFDEAICMTMLFGIKGAPIKLPMDGMMAATELFTHVMMEMAERAIPATDFQHSPERMVAAATRLGLPPHVAAWVGQDFSKDVH